MSDLYIVQQPNSNSNKTKKYRVIRHGDWLAWCDNGDPKAVIEASGEYDTYQEAERTRDILNDQIRAERRCSPQNS